MNIHMTQDEKTFIVLILLGLYLLFSGLIKRKSAERKAKTKKNSRKPLISKRYENISYVSVTKNENTQVVKTPDNSFEYRAPLNAEFSPVIRKNNK